MKALAPLDSTFLAGEESELGSVKGIDGHTARLLGTAEETAEGSMARRVSTSQDKSTDAPLKEVLEAGVAALQKHITEVGAFEKSTSSMGAGTCVAAAVPQIYTCTPDPRHSLGENGIVEAMQQLQQRTFNIMKYIKCKAAQGELGALLDKAKVMLQLSSRQAEKLLLLPSYHEPYLTPYDDNEITNNLIQFVINVFMSANIPGYSSAQFKNILVRRATTQDFWTPTTNPPLIGVTLTIVSLTRVWVRVGVLPCPMYVY